jgi:Holliday junction resolvasome RuvABC endonuclease subunit
VIVVGLDLSLTSTGVAWLDGHTHHAETFTTTPKDELGARLEAIKDRCWRVARGAELVVVEDVVATSRNGATVAMVQGVIRWQLWRDHVPHTFVPPATLKVFATGRGNADKGAMIAEACRRLDYQGSSNDQVDALWLAHLGAYHVGRPAVDLPQTHLRALTKIKAVAA